MRVVIPVFLALLAVTVLGLAAVAIRRRWLSRRGGVFDCSLREKPKQFGKGWMLGVARYTDDTIEWYRVFSFSPRPRRVLARRGFVVLTRRQPSDAESYALLPGAVIVECSLGGRRLELGLGQDALTGLLAWLEASPPGRDVNVVA